MPKIYGYQPVSDQYTTYRMRLPQGAVELCTLDGIAYVSIPDDAELPEQPREITIEPAALTDGLRTAIKAQSSHFLLIDECRQARIRQRYSADDEAYFARIGIGVALGAYQFQPGEQEALLAFGAHAEACRQWAREQRAALGL